MTCSCVNDQTYSEPCAFCKGVGNGLFNCDGECEECPQELNTEQEDLILAREDKETCELCKEDVSPQEISKVKIDESGDCLEICSSCREGGLE